ncbi:MAG: YgaP family membrane protein [Alphaproteobacteria bacterium]
MSIQKLPPVIVGTLVLVGIILAELVHHDWILLTSFAGIMMIISGITGCCPMKILLRKCNCSVDNENTKKDKK